MYKDKGNAPKLLTKFLQKKLSGILSDFLKRFDISKIDLSLSDNHIVLLNLELREDLLTKLMLPLVVFEGKIGKITIKIPLMYGKSNSNITVENVLIKVKSIREKRFDNSESQEHQKKGESEVNFKKQRIKDWESNIKKYFEEVNSAGYIKNTIDNVVNNMIIKFTNIILIFQNQEDLNNPFAVRLKIERLTIFPTNENWKPTYNKDVHEQRKKIEISGFSISLYFFTKKRKHLFKMGNFGSKKNRVKQMGQLVHTITTSMINNINLNEKNYLLSPFSFEVRLTMRKGEAFDLKKVAKMTVEVIMKNPLIITMCKEQIETLLEFSKNLNDLMKIHKNLHIRPTSDLISGDSKEAQEIRCKWWVYAITAVIQEKKSKLDFLGAFNKYSKFKRYILLYKRQKKIISARWLPELTHDEREELAEMEDNFTWQEIIKFREWALIELRIEAKRFMMSDSDIKNQSKNLTDIWANCADPEEIKIKNSKEREYKSKSQIQLTEAERNGLYEMLALDKKRVIMSFMDGEFHQNETIMTELKVHMNSFYLLFAQLKDKKISTENENTIKKFVENYGEANYRHYENNNFKEKSKKSGMSEEETERKDETDGPEETYRRTKDVNWGVKGKMERNFKKDFEDLFEEKVFVNPKDGHNNDTDEQEDSEILAEAKAGHGKFDTDEKEKAAKAQDQNKKNLRKILKYTETMQLLFVLELINLNGEIIIKRNSDIKSSNIITLEVINLFDTNFLDVAPDIKEFRKNFTHSKNEIEDINKSLSKFLILNDHLAPSERGNNPEKKHIFFPLSRKEKGDQLFKSFAMKSRIVSKTMFDLALNFEISEKPIFHVFLDKYKLNNIISFLETFKNDAKNHEELMENFKLDSFSKFFQRNQSTFLFLTRSLESLGPHIDESNKIEFIETAHRLVIFLIREHLYTTFCKEYGIYIFPKLIPMCDDMHDSFDEDLDEPAVQQEGVQYYKTKIKDIVTNLANLAKFVKQDNRRKTEKKEGEKNYVLSLDFEINNSQDFFKIIQNTIKVSPADHVKNLFKGNNQPDQMEADLQEIIQENLDSEEEKATPDEVEEKRDSMLNLECKPLNIFISLPTLKEIMILIYGIGTDKSDKSIIENIDYDLIQRVKDNLFNQPLSYYKDKLKNKISSLMRFSAKIDTVTLSLYETKNFLVNNHIVNVKLMDIDLNQDIPKEEEIKTTEGVNRELEILVKEIQCSTQNTEEPKEVVFMESAARVTLVDSLIDDHPLLTDSIIDIFVPFLNLNLPKVPYSVSRMLNSILVSDLVERPREKVDTDLRATVITGIMDEIDPILSELFNSDHKSGLNPCRHCIIKYKKSILKVRVCVGYQGKGKDQRLEQFCNGEVEELDNGIMINLPVKFLKINKDRERKKRRSMNLFPSMSSNSKNRKKIEDSEEIIEIVAPYIHFVLDKGLFRNYMTVHAKKIEAKSNSLDFSILPFWRLTHNFILKDKERNLLLNFWSLCLNYEAQINKREGYNNLESKVIKQKNKLIEDTDLYREDKIPKDSIFLVYFEKNWVNKRLLSIMENGRKGGETKNKAKGGMEAMMDYKDVLMSKIHKVSLSGHEISLVSYLLNYFLMFNESTEVYNFFQNLYNYQKQVKLPDMKKRLKMTKQNLDISRNKFKKSKEEGSIGSRGNKKQNNLFLSILTSLRLLLSINKVEVTFFFYEAISQKFFQINLNLNELSFKLEKLNPEECLIVSSKQKFNEKMGNEELVKRYIKMAKLKELSISMSSNSLKIKNIVLLYNYQDKKFEIYLNYFLINDKNSADERILQIGLDDPEIAYQLNHDAIKITCVLDDFYQIKNIHCELKHSKVSLEKSLILRDLKLITALKAHLLKQRVLMLTEIVKFFRIGRKISILTFVKNYQKYQKMVEKKVHEIAAMVNMKSKAKKEEELKIKITCASLNVVLKQPKINSIRTNNNIQVFLNIEINDLDIFYDNKESFRIKMTDVNITPSKVQVDYNSLLISRKKEKSLELMIRLDSEKNELIISLFGIKVFFLNRVIEEIVDFYDCFEDQVMIFRAQVYKEIQLDEAIEEQEISSEESLKIVLDIVNSEVIVPGGSNSKQHVRLEVDSAYLTIGDGSKVIDVPKGTTVKHVIDDTMVIDVHKNERIKFRTNLIEGLLNNVRVALKLYKNEDTETNFGQVKEISLKVDAVPGSLRRKKHWNPITEVGIDLKGLLLETTFGHLSGLIDIFKNNIDEESEYLPPSGSYWKKIRFGLNISDGNFGLGMLRIDQKAATKLKEE